MNACCGTKATNIAPNCLDPGCGSLIYFVSYLDAVCANPIPTPLPQLHGETFWHSLTTASFTVNYCLL